MTDRAEAGSADYDAKIRVAESAYQFWANAYARGALVDSGMPDRIARHLSELRQQRSAEPDGDGRPGELDP